MSRVEKIGGKVTVGKGVSELFSLKTAAASIAERVSYNVENKLANLVLHVQTQCPKSELNGPCHMKRANRQWAGNRS